MAPRHPPLACQETLLEEEEGANQETALVTTSEPFGGFQVEEVFLYGPLQIAARMYPQVQVIRYSQWVEIREIEIESNHIPIPPLPFFHSIFDNNFQRGLPPVTRLFEDDSQPLESDNEAEESDGDNHPPESDDESDKENQDPNGGSNTQAIAVAREGQLPREEDYFDAQVVTELEELGNSWRQFMGGALRAPQPHSPSITELYSEPH